MNAGIIKKIISGGQSGVDRAALDAALESGLPVGGWCPKGRKAEDGMIDRKYPLRETAHDDYKTRTYLNVRDSDAILIMMNKKADQGTRLTIEFAPKSNKPILEINLENDRKSNLRKLISWLELHHPEKLNIAGPRERSNPGIYQKSYDFLKELFSLPGV